jgi:hypothetical protein
MNAKRSLTGEAQPINGKLIVDAEPSSFFHVQYVIYALQTKQKCTLLKRSVLRGERRRMTSLQNASFYGEVRQHQSSSRGI